MLVAHYEKIFERVILSLIYFGMKTVPMTSCQMAKGLHSHYVRIRVQVTKQAFLASISINARLGAFDVAQRPAQ